MEGNTNEWGSEMKRQEWTDGKKAAKWDYGWLRCVYGGCLYGGCLYG